jgi:hypothetical protein
MFKHLTFCPLQTFIEIITLSIRFTIALYASYYLALLKNLFVIRTSITCFITLFKFYKVIKQFTVYKNIVSFNEKFKFIIKNNKINNFILEQFNTKDQITLFHKTYKYDKKEKLLYNYNELIYFCYRSNIFPIQNKNNVYLFRDSGWGCMIRCGQMIMSRAIYKYLKSKKFSTEKAISETIKYFLDLPYSEKAVPSIFSSILSYNLNTNINNNIKLFPPFSIHMHCFLGKFYNKHGGERFSDINICQNFCEINKYFNLFPELSILSFVSDFK